MRTLVNMRPRHVTRNSGIGTVDLRDVVSHVFVLTVDVSCAMSCVSSSCRKLIFFLSKTRLNLKTVPVDCGLFNLFPLFFN